jgi:type IV pilus assembly protein PilP
MKRSDVKPLPADAKLGWAVSPIILIVLIVPAIGFAQPASEAKQPGGMVPVPPASIPSQAVGGVAPILGPSQSVSGQPESMSGAAAVPGTFETEVPVYDPAGRRDPFIAIVQLDDRKIDDALPPLQRVAVTEINLIAVVWGGYGYTGMVQTPDGKGYVIRKGTRLGTNNGLVTSITERGVIVVERFTDVYGNKQEREYVKLLHPKEAAE